LFEGRQGPFVRTGGNFAVANRPPRVIDDSNFDIRAPNIHTRIKRSFKVLGKLRSHGINTIEKEREFANSIKAGRF
jgi:hypothetical protein